MNHPDPPALVRAIVLKAQPALVERGKHHAHRIAILREDGRRTHVSGDSLTYQGYCNFCGAPAVLSRDALICPKCSEAATAVPPPDELTLRWYPLGTAYHAIAVRACLLTGCSWSEGLDTWRKPHQRALGAMLTKHRLNYGRAMHEDPWNNYDFEETMQWYAELGDDDSFLACYKANGGKDYARTIDMMLEIFDQCLEAVESDQPGPSRRLNLPASDLARSADDSAPDGADELTAWLGRQFGRGA